MKVQGLVALITGGASGFGKEFATSLLKKGARGVSLLDISVEEGQDTAKALSDQFGADRVLFRETDVTSDDQFEESFKSTVDKFKQLDVVCNNAGIINELDWAKTIDINLTGVMRGTYLAKKYMDKNTGGNGGLVINISSMAGILFVPFAPAYTAAKRGVIGFTNSISAPGGDAAFKQDNIRINTICPTFALTPMLLKLPPPGLSKEAIQKFLACFPTVPIPLVIEAYMKVIEEDELHGKVIRITKENGIDFQKYNHVPMPEIKI